MKSRWNQALVVGSNPLHRAALEFELAKTGFVVTPVTDAEDAFDLAEKQHFDLVITDLKTPHGSGVDLARQLRQLQRYAATPIILLADEDAELDLEFLRSNLWLLVIRAPYNIAALVQKLSRHLAPQQASC